MMEVDRSLTSDWTKNWNARLPIKITSIVLWGIAIIGLLISAILLWGGEREIEEQIQSNADRFAYRWAENSRNYDLNRNQAVQNVAKLAKQLGFVAVQVKVGGQQYVWGEEGAKDGVITRTVTLWSPNDVWTKATLILFYPPLDKTFRAQQKRWLWSMVAICLIFGLILSWAMHKVVTKPFEALVDGTQYVASGNLNFRFDASRPDEFGDLARFFNEMVDNVAKQQDALKTAVAKAEKLTRAKMSKLQESQDQLLVLNRQMSDEIAERKHVENALLIAKQEAEMANQAKSIFLANMSHEIRTPMNAILGYAQILMRDASLGEEHKGSVVTIERSGHHLLQLINDILDLSKIEAGKQKINANDFDLQALVREVSEMFRLRCQQKKLQWIVTDFSCIGPMHVFGDEGKIRQILINLLGNAVKFTTSGSISLQAQPLDNDRYRFDVFDTGEGISESGQTNIFQAFQQTEQGIKKGGTGLGLAISSKQVKMMGSELRLNSVVGKGSQFYFVLELPRASHTFEDRVVQTKAVLAIAEGHQVKALVADDVEVNRDLLSMILQKVGVKVVEAENGVVAVDKARTEHPNIIFMDYRMPEMDGVEAIKRIRSEFGDEIKMVIVSATAFEHDREKFFQSGCNDLITKPYQAEDVFSSLQRLLGVEYVYEDDTQAQDEPPVELNFSELVLPLGLVESLLEAAEYCMITDLDVAIQNVSELGAEGKRLAQTLSQYAKAYDMEAIIDVLRQIQHG